MEQSEPSDDNINFDYIDNDNNPDAEFDQDGQQLDQIFSEGFSAPADNDDPFRQNSYPTSVIENSDNSIQGTDPITTIFRGSDGTKEKNNNEVSFNETKKTSLKLEEKKRRPKQSMAKGKPFKVLKAPKAHSNGSEEAIDPEEEKLKMLPDCCEFTARRNDPFEVDESKKDMNSIWLSQVKLTPAQQKNLCFSESLLMVEETGVVVGKYYTNITASKWNDKPCLCVNSGSFGKFSTGLESGTSITSFVNYKLHPLQEFVHEWCSLNSDTIERKTFLMKEMEMMSGKITLLRNGKIVDNKALNLGLKERDNLITEGTNLLLLRLLILERRTTGSMFVQSLSYTGKVVRAKYGELGSGWENVKGKQMKTWGIRRTVYVSEDEEREWDSLFNKNSRLVLRCQPESPQALIPLWFESIIEFDKHGNFIGSYSPYAWACDMELYSKYAVKKEELTHEHRRYILDHPEVRALLSDYLQSILFRKPQNVLEFTKQYFESFLNLHAKPSRMLAKKKETLSLTSSYLYSTSSLTAEDFLGEGEWLGEGEDGDAGAFYPINPTVSYGGLEQVDETDDANQESEMITTENETEDDLVVNEKGQYVRSGQ